MHLLCILLSPVCQCISFYECVDKFQFKITVVKTFRTDLKISKAILGLTLLFKIIFSALVGGKGLGELM